MFFLKRIVRSKTFLLAVGVVVAAIIAGLLIIGIVKILTKGPGGSTIY